MDGSVKMTLSIYKSVPSIMTLTLKGTEKYEVSEAYHKVNEAKILIKCIHWMARLGGQNHPWF